MIVQHTKALNYTKPTDLFNYIIDTYKDEEYINNIIKSINSA